MAIIRASRSDAAFFDIVATGAEGTEYPKDQLEGHEIGRVHAQTFLPFLKYNGGIAMLAWIVFDIEPRVAFGSAAPTASRIQPPQ